MFSQTLAHGNSKNEIRKKKNEEDQKRRVSKLRSKAGTKKNNPDSLSPSNQNIIIINKILLFYKIWKKYNEIQLTKNKIDLNDRKMKNHPPSPGGPEQSKIKDYTGLAIARDYLSQGSLRPKGVV